MRAGPPAHRSGAFAALTVITGLGACLVAAACMVPTMLAPVAAWPALSAGSAAVIVGLAGLWWIERRREHGAP